MDTTVSTYVHPLSGPLLLSRKTSYHKISWSIEAVRCWFWVVRPPWNLTDVCQISECYDNVCTNNTYWNIVICLPILYRIASLTCVHLVGCHNEITRTTNTNRIHNLYQLISLWTTFSDAFSWMKCFAFWSKFHWNLFLRIQLTIFQHWFR